ncbi:hypothetical protein [Spongiibacter marinus]|uniref:hypothetical protein n=1 Tax=Spongiibacter marinus TaxID=354246 RepID=UPI0035BE874D
MRKTIAILALAVGCGANGHADELSDAAMAMCEKARQCARQSMAGVELSADMRALVDQQLMQMCDSMKEPFTDAAARSHPLHGPAVACLRSMAKQSCEALDGGEETAACKRYEALQADY